MEPRWRWSVDVGYIFEAFERDDVAVAEAREQMVSRLMFEACSMRRSSRFEPWEVDNFVELVQNMERGETTPDFYRDFDSLESWGQCDNAMLFA